MKIVKKRSRRTTVSLIPWIAAAGVILILIVLISQEGAGFTSSKFDALRSLLPASTRADLPVLIIDMPFTEYDRILSQRQEAMASGVVISGAQDFVSADIRYQDQSVPVEIRLQQGKAVHLGENDKWNFEVRTLNNQLLSGMQRFYLIDPSDNNWMNEAAFANALRREGLVAGQYQFVQLFLNGENKGIYALQEGFGSELLARNGREEGVIVEFDATPLWKSIAYYEGDLEALTADPISNLSASDFQFFEVDTFRDASIAQNEGLTQQKNRAIGLLRGLQSGELAASEVFDVEKYGRFLALTDLWGASQTTSLVNLRYYYNPQSNRLEPIGFNGNPLASSQRLPISATYGDFDLQSAYVKASARMSKPDYLAELQDDLGSEVASYQQVLSNEEELNLPWEALEERGGEIGRSLSPLQPVFAYLGPPSLAQEGIIQVDVANVLNLPVEFLGFDIDGATFLEVDPEWVQKNQEELLSRHNGELFLRAQDGDHTRPVRYVRFHLPVSLILSQDNELDFLQELDIQIATRIAGLENIQLTSARPGYPDPLTIQPTFATDQ